MSIERKISVAMESKRLKRLIILVLAVLLVFLIFQIGTAARYTQPADTSLADKAEKADKTRELESQASRIIVNNVGEMVIPSGTILRELDGDVLQEIYHRYIQNIQVRCRRQLHLGNEEIGGYHVCEDYEVAPTPPCLAYSFGIRKDFTFDDGVASTFGCEVHSFDPTVSQNLSLVPQLEDIQHSENVTFHQLSIGEEDEDTDKGVHIKILSSIRNMLGHENRNIDILKLDTEGAEWSSLQEMVKTGSIDHVRQLIVEFHVYTTKGKVFLTSSTDYMDHLNLLRGLYRHGFRIFYFRMWNRNEGNTVFTNEAGTRLTGCNVVHFMRPK